MIMINCIYILSAHFGASSCFYSATLLTVLTLFCFALLLFVFFLFVVDSVLLLRRIVFFDSFVYILLASLHRMAHVRLEGIIC